MTKRAQTTNLPKMRVSTLLRTSTRPEKKTPRGYENTCGPFFFKKNSFANACIHALERVYNMCKKHPGVDCIFLKQTPRVPTKSAEIKMATCRSCGLFLSNIMQLGSHRRSCPGLEHGSSDDSLGRAWDTDSETQEQTQAVGIIQQASFAPFSQTTPLHKLARRCAKGKQVLGKDLLVQFDEQVIRRGNGYGAQRKFDRKFQNLQGMWNEYVKTCYESCCPSFWKVHQAVRHQSGACRDEIFKTVCNMIDPALKTGLAWPRSNRLCKGCGANG